MASGLSLCVCNTKSRFSFSFAPKLPSFKGENTQRFGVSFFFCLVFIQYALCLYDKLGTGHGLEKRCVPDNYNTEHSKSWRGVRTGMRSEAPTERCQLCEGCWCPEKASWLREEEAGFTKREGLGQGVESEGQHQHRGAE